MYPVRPVLKSLALAIRGGLSTSLLLALPAHAQGSDAALRVEVTGSSIKRIAAETALPVQVLSREEIARTGVTNAEQLLKTVSATSTLGSTSVANTGAGGGQGGTNSVSLISLRGLGSARTLVLINGRRSAPAGGSSAVDIATIPVAAIERVEVLKDGASAVYGSDAVAGVVNFILRRDYSGTEVAVTLGTPTRSGGGTETKVSVFSGLGDFDKDGYAATLSASYQTVKPIFGADRSFARNIDVEHQLDKTNATATFPANIRLPNGTAVSANYPNCGPYSLASPLLPGVCRYDNAPYDALQPDSKLANFSAGGRLNLSGSVEAYGDASYAQNKTLNTVQHVLINGAALPAGHPYISTLTNLINTQYAGLPAAQVTQLRSLIGSAWALLPPSSPYYPTAFAAANGLSNQPLVLLYSKNKITTNLKQGWVETDKYLKLVNTGVINPFGDTTDAAARAAALDSNYNGLLNITTTSVKGVDLKASRELFKLEAGTVNLALGAEFRKEALSIAPSDANKEFRISGFGAPGVPVAANRNVTSAFAEVVVPVFKSLELDAAVRYDDYERVGSTTNPKLSLRFQPSDAFLLRASAGSGFRAPTLSDLYSPQARGITTNGQRDRLRCPVVSSTNLDCSTQYVTIGGGNPELQPEKSRSLTLGLVWEPVKDYSISVDMFNVTIKEVIVSGAVSVANILADPVRYASLIQRGAPDGNASGVGPITGILQGLVNLGKTVVGGVDIDLKGRVLNTPEHKLALRLNGTYLTKYERQNLDGSYSSAINNPASSGIGIGVAIRWRHTASATWDTGPWSSTLTQNFQDSYRDLRTALQASSVQPRDVASYMTWDAQLAYGGFKATKLTLGVKNLSDKNPPYTNYGAGFVGSYDLSYTDVRGRFVYLTAQYTFK
jgi:iron complex outermembrane recepter protein